jgi:hypothetical protein
MHNQAGCHYFFAIPAHLLKVSRTSHSVLGCQHEQPLSQRPNDQSE